MYLIFFLYYSSYNMFNTWDPYNGDNITTYYMLQSKRGTTHTLCVQLHTNTSHNYTHYTYYAYQHAQQAWYIYLELAARAENLSSFSLSTQIWLLVIARHDALLKSACCRVFTKYPSSANIVESGGFPFPLFSLQTNKFLSLFALSYRDLTWAMNTSKYWEPFTFQLISFSQVITCLHRSDFAQHDNIPYCHNNTIYMHCPFKRFKTYTITNRVPWCNYNRLNHIGNLFLARVMPYIFMNITREW